MRHVNEVYANPTSTRGMAKVAKNFAEVGYDERAGVGVGAALMLKYDKYSDNPIGETRPVYGGCNIHYSGMQTKVHAEQFALFQAILDMRLFNSEDILEDRVKVMVATTEGNGSLYCGNCIQVLWGFCSEFGVSPEDVKYGALVEDGDNWDYRMTNLKDMMEHSYTERM